MAGDDRQGVDEQWALEELERLKRAIEDTQRRRQQATEAFDRFMRSLDEPAAATAGEPAAPAAGSAIPPAAARPDEAQAPATESPVAQSFDTPPAASTPVASTPAGDQPPITPPAVSSPAVNQPPAAPPAVSAPVLSERTDLDVFPHEEPQRSEPEPVAVRAIPPSALPAYPPETPPAAPFERHVPAALAPPAPQAGGKGRFIAVAALVGLLLAAFAAVFMRGGGDATVAPQPAAAGPASNPAAARPAPVAPAPAPAASTPVPAAELITVRRVWVRVLVDGERAVERELDADVRIPLNPRQSVVVRAGDAGAVRLAIGGKDQGAIGRDGEVMTRTFTMPPASARPVTTPPAGR